jgi:hypothetical protein
MRKAMATFLLLAAFFIPSCTKAQNSPCGPIPFHACVKTWVCTSDAGWQPATTDAEGAACSTTYGGPTNGTCSVTAPHGVIRPTASCTPCPTYSVGGTISGLNGRSVVIQNNNGAPFTVSKSPFTFPVKVANCLGYSVTVQEPSGGSCTIDHASGTSKGANVTDVSISCLFVHTRQDIAKLTAQQIASLQHGFAVMMQNCTRTATSANTDPTCLTFQANVHATEMGEMNGCQMGENNPLWDQCQHASFFFLAWHRMYLYYFEKILRGSSGDPNLAIPYWNYELPSEQALPSPFLSPAIDCLGDPSAHPGCNPLYLTGRSMNGGQDLPIGAADDSAAMMDAVFETSFGENFGGGLPSPQVPCHFDGYTGALEAQPHNVIHCDVGGDMCDPGTAARDPIFWLHHSEIDHLWKVWLAEGGGRTNPTDTTWLNTPFQFYDYDTRSVVTKSGKDVLDTVAQLGYRYDDDPPASSPAAPAPPAPPPPESQQAFPPTPPAEMAVATETGIALSNEPTHAQINISADAKAKIAQMLVDKQYKHAFVLNLEIDHVQDSGGVSYEIYAGLPANEKPARDSIYYVGTLGLFLHRGAETSLKFDVTKTIRAMHDKNVWSGNDLAISFVPHGLLNPQNQQPEALQPGVRATIERVSLLAQ